MIGRIFSKIIGSQVSNASSSSSSSSYNLGGSIAYPSYIGCVNMVFLCLSRMDSFGLSCFRSFSKMGFCVVDVYVY